ncbi:MAG: hypothetical protein R6U15_03080 [Candidatus Izemoplasmatales bacterium]
MDNYNKINVDVDSDFSEFSQLFENYDIIQLTDGIYGKIKKVCQKNDKLVFQTYSGDRRVHILDLKLNVITSVAEKGKGPNQFISIEDIYI